jgi:hypothetical protein
MVEREAEKYRAHVDRLPLFLLRMRTTEQTITVAVRSGPIKGLGRFWSFTTVRRSAAAG